MAEIERRRGQSSTYTEKLPRDAPDLKDFLMDFYRNIVFKRQAEMMEEVFKYPKTVGKFYNELVPSVMAYEDFWQRYYYRTASVERVMAEIEVADQVARQKRADAIKESWNSVQNLMGNSSSSNSNRADSDPSPYSAAANPLDSISQRCISTPPVGPAQSTLLKTAVSPATSKSPDKGMSPLSSNKPSAAISVNKGSTSAVGLRQVPILVDFPTTNVVELGESPADSFLPLESSSMLASPVLGEFPTAEQLAPPPPPPEKVLDLIPKRVIATTIATTTSAFPPQQQPQPTYSTTAEPPTPLLTASLKPSTRKGVDQAMSDDDDDTGDSAATASPLIHNIKATGSGELKTDLFLPSLDTLEAQAPTSPSAPTPPTAAPSCPFRVSEAATPTTPLNNTGGVGNDHAGSAAAPVTPQPIAPNTSTFVATTAPLQLDFTSAPTSPNTTAATTATISTSLETKLSDAEPRNEAVSDKTESSDSPSKPPLQEAEESSESTTTRTLLVDFPSAPTEKVSAKTDSGFVDWPLSKSAVNHVTPDVPERGASSRSIGSLFTTTKTDQEQPENIAPTEEKTSQEETHSEKIVISGATALGAAPAGNETVQRPTDLAESSRSSNDRILFRDLFKTKKKDDISALPPANPPEKDKEELLTPDASVSTINSVMKVTNDAKELGKDATGAAESSFSRSVFGSIFKPAAEGRQPLVNSIIATEGQHPLVNSRNVDEIQQPLVKSMIASKQEKTDVDDMNRSERGFGVLFGRTKEADKNKSVNEPVANAPEQRSPSEPTSDMDKNTSNNSGFNRFFKIINNQTEKATAGATTTVAAAKETTKKPPIPVAPPVRKVDVSNRGYGGLIKSKETSSLKVPVVGAKEVQRTIHKRDTDREPSKLRGTTSMAQQTANLAKDDAVSWTKSREASSKSGSFWKRGRRVENFTKPEEPQPPSFSRASTPTTSNVASMIEKFDKKPAPVVAVVPPKRHVKAIGRKEKFLALIGVVVATVVGMVLLQPAWSVSIGDVLCAPVFPGRKLAIVKGLGDDVDFVRAEAPWWAKASIKQESFERICGEDRVRTVLKWTESKPGVRRLDLLDALTDKRVLLSRKRLVSAQFFASNIVVQYLDEKKTETLDAPWSYGRH